MCCTPVLGPTWLLGMSTLIGKNIIHGNCHFLLFKIFLQLRPFFFGKKVNCYRKSYTSVEFFLLLKIKNKFLIQTSMFDEI